ncbi:MAG: alanine racemase, partial [Rikenellaceae bacterium]
AHQENFLSYEHKLSEKLQIAKESQSIIFPADHTLINNTIKEVYPSKRLFSWGKSELADVRVLEQSRHHVKFEYLSQSYTIPLLLDDNNIYENIMSVISLYALLGHDLSKVCQRCASLEGVEVRLKIKNGNNDCKVITDNSRSDINAIKIALGSLVSITQKQKKVVILSNVSVLGVAKLLQDNDISKVISIGIDIPEYKGLKEHFETTDDLLQHIEHFENSAILIIGEKLDKISSLFDQKRHSTVMEVNLSAMVHNLAYYKKIVGKNVKMVTMVKAFSYGSGSFDVAEALSREGVDYFAVAYLDEGIALREKEIDTPIIILNSNVNDYDLILKNNLQPEIYSLYTLNKFIEICSERGFENYPIHIKLDTGMSRLGFSEDDLPVLNKILNNNKCVSVESVFSHFSSSDMPENDYETDRQIALFEKMSSTINYKLRHICNSAGIERFPKAHYDMVRLGIGLYGISPIENGGALENVNSLHTIVLQVRDIKKGTHVGYGMRGCAQKDMTLATIGIGYADGLHRAFGNGVWSMHVRGAKAPIVGSICMDTCMIDVTGLNVMEGDNVVVFDSSQEICQMAELIGTIPYEILTSISARIKRVYINE